MSKNNKHNSIGRRSGEAIAAQHRPPVVMRHRLQPRGGARNIQAEILTDYEDDAGDYDQESW
jgi:hypothetical protein